MFSSSIENLGDLNLPASTAICWPESPVMIFELLPRNLNKVSEAPEGIKLNNSLTDLSASAERKSASTSPFR